MCWSVIPGDSLPRGDHHRPEWIAGKESSTPSRPITTRCLSSILLIHGWIKFTTALLRILIGYPREIPWRDGHSFTRKNNYHTRNHIWQFVTTGELSAEVCSLLQLGSSTWQYLPVTSSMAHVFPLIFTQLFTLHCLLTFVHTTAMLGSNQLSNNYFLWWCKLPKIC